MKIAVFSESSADEAAIRILVEGLLSQQAAELADLPALRTRGWPSVRQVLPTVIKALHYQTDAEALVVVVDSDLSPIHHSEHDEAGKALLKCRLCQLREVIQKTQTQLRPVANRPRLRVALGLAVPCLEAWFRYGLDAQVTEAAWLQAQPSGKYPFDGRRLKEAVYGTDRPSLELETTRMCEEARRWSRSLLNLKSGSPMASAPWHARYEAGSRAVGRCRNKKVR
jgi:hypothetical protein